MSFFENGELKDKEILKALTQAIGDYENGAIIEAKDTLIDIVNSITEFEQYENVTNTISPQQGFAKD